MDIYLGFGEPAGSKNTMFTNNKKLLFYKENYS